MANDYIANHEDFLAVANAIRAKAETDASLAFPDDFLSVISGLQVGSGIPATISALAAGTIIPSSKQTTFTIEHGMGVTPNFILIRDQDEGEFASNSQKILQSIESVFNTQTIRVISYTSASSIVAKYGYSTTGKLYSANSTSFTTYSFGSDYFFVAGHTYHWICGVLEAQ